MLLRDPLGEAVEQGETAIGMYATSDEIIEVAAHVGMDFVVLDQMLTGLDWSALQGLLRTSKAAGITPVVRIQSTPWLGYDRRVPTDVSRAVGVGAPYIKVSNAGLRDVEECLKVAHGFKYNLMSRFPNDPYGRADSMLENVEIIPQPETEDSLDAFADTIALEDVRIHDIALGDASVELTGDRDPDWEDERIWEFIDEAVALGEKHDTVVGANPPFLFKDTSEFTLEEMADRVVRLQEHGIRVITLDPGSWLFQMAMRNHLADITDRIGR